MGGGYGRRVKVFLASIGLVGPIIPTETTLSALDRTLTSDDLRSEGKGGTQNKSPYMQVAETGKADVSVDVLSH
ncbi:hypothetical protein M1N56_07835 [Dehalococcoidia bacterium]|nr:hypothetical protein [Dehalococcoidia bacterium]